MPSAPCDEAPEAVPLGARQTHHALKEALSDVVFLKHGDVGLLGYLSCGLLESEVRHALERYELPVHLAVGHALTLALADRGVDGLC